MIVGVMGAGQLGQMLALAAGRLGCRLRFLSPDDQAPAGRFSELIVADYENEAALAHFVEGLDLATYEFESIPSSAVRFVAERVPTFPPPLALETAQDRVREKECFERLGIPTAPFAAVESMSEVRQALEKTGLPAVLKSRRLGYDGVAHPIPAMPIIAATIVLFTCPPRSEKAPYETTASLRASAAPPCFVHRQDHLRSP